MLEIYYQTLERLHQLLERKKRSPTATVRELQAIREEIKDVRCAIQHIERREGKW